MFVHKNESIMFHVERKEKTKALEMISRLYSSYDSKVHDDVYEDFRYQIESKSTGGDDEVKPNLIQTLTGRDYRVATWLSCFLAVA